MSNPKCVALKCEVKDIFDKNLTSAVLKQIKQTVQTQIDKSKGLSFDANCKDGWLLTATVLALKVDNTDKPTSTEAKVMMEAVPLDGSTHGFKAPGNAKATSTSTAVIARNVIPDLTQGKSGRSTPRATQSSSATGLRRTPSRLRWARAR